MTTKVRRDLRNYGKFYGYIVIMDVPYSVVVFVVGHNITTAQYIKGHVISALLSANLPLIVPLLGMAVRAALVAMQVVTL